MSKVPFFCSLYVSHPPIPKQKLLHNNVTAYLINLSEYVIASPCKYPSYLASLSLRLREVPSSTLQKVTLVAFWLIFAVFHKNLWKVGVCLVCVKLINRAGFSKPISPPQLPSKVPPRSPSPSPLAPLKVKKEVAPKPKSPSPGLGLSGTLKISASPGGESVTSSVASSFCWVHSDNASQKGSQQQEPGTLTTSSGVSLDSTPSRFSLRSFVLISSYESSFVEISDDM